MQFIKKALIIERKIRKMNSKKKVNDWKKEYLA
jgi:hypothetical protein